MSAEGWSPEEREAGARAYAADTYRGCKDLNGAQATWDTLTESDRAACQHKADVVLDAVAKASAQRSEQARAEALVDLAAPFGMGLHDVS